MSTTLRLGGVTANSVVDGPGLRTVIFLQGCPRHCPGCHNEKLLEPTGGREVTVEEAVQEIKAQISPITQGITLSGGDPLLQPEAAYHLANQLKQELPHLDLWLYTGYTYDQVKELPVLELVDVLVDGPFLLEQKDLALVFRGSANQRLINVKKTRESGQVVLWEPQTW